MNGGEQDFSQHRQVDNPEDKEKEKPMPIYFIYRDNDLFKEWMPKIQKKLDTLGYQTKVQAFPANTEENEIMSWLVENKSNYDGKDLVTDDTVSNARYEVVERNRGIFKEFKGSLRNEGYLDNLYGNLAEKLFIETKIEDSITTEGIKSIKTDEKIFTEMIQEIIKYKGQPKKIFIISTMCGSHLGQGKDSAGSLEEYEKLFGCSRTARREDRKKYDSKAAKLFKEWFIQGGAIQDKIEINDYIDKNMDEAGNWIVYDRHLNPLTMRKLCGVEKPTITKAIELELPIGDFIETATRNNLLRLSSEQVEKLVMENLEKRFSPESN